MALPIGMIILLLLAFAFIGLAIKLCVASRREETVPEALVGVFFAGIAFELVCYAVFVPGDQEVLKGIAVTASSVSMMAFVRAVFRPDSEWAQIVFWALSIAIGAVFVLVPMVDEPRMTVRFWWSAFRGAALGWAFAECTAYYIQMRKRLALGLAEPVVVNRFLLWSLWTGGAAMIPLSGLAVRLLTLLGITTDYTQTREGSIGAYIFAFVLFSSLAIAVYGLWLSFFPPRFYRGWVERRARAS